jgi:hypothetical protein
MTWALLGWPHKKSVSASGWAWVDARVDPEQHGAVVAASMAQFVAKTLKEFDRDDREAGGTDGSTASAQTAGRSLASMLERAALGV